MRNQQRIVEMLELSENEKFARMVVALETIADAMTAERHENRKPRVIPEIEQTPMVLVKLTCSNCGFVVHEVTDGYRHCTMCGKLSAVN